MAPTTPSKKQARIQTLFTDNLSKQNTLKPLVLKNRVGGAPEGITMIFHDSWHRFLHSILVFARSATNIAEYVKTHAKHLPRTVKMPPINIQIKDGTDTPSNIHPPQFTKRITTLRSPNAGAAVSTPHGVHFENIFSYHYSVVSKNISAHTYIYIYVYILCIYFRTCILGKHMLYNTDLTRGVTRA